MIEKKIIKIKCPICGTEYLPEEIYTNILGNPKDIIKDEKGKILYFKGESLDLDETFTCDNCNSDFKVSLSPKFIVEPISWEDEF